MAKAYKCDICGELFEGCYTVAIYQGFNCRINVKRKDLCPTCVETIQKAAETRFKLKKAKNGKDTE